MKSAHVASVVSTVVGFSAAWALFFLVGRADEALPSAPPNPIPSVLVLTEERPMMPAPASDTGEAGPTAPTLRIVAAATPVPATTLAREALAASPTRTESVVALSAIAASSDDIFPAASGTTTTATGGVGPVVAADTSTAPDGVAKDATPATVDRPSTTAPAPTTPVPPESRRLRGVSAPARPRSAPEPPYPARVRARDGEGAVSVRLRIDASGKVESVEVLGASGDPALRQSVVDTVRLWTFDPALEDGRSVPSSLIRRFVFRLDDPR